MTRQSLMTMVIQIVPLSKSTSVAKCRGSWVVGRGRGSWVVGVGVGKCRGYRKK